MKKLKSLFLLSFSLLISAQTMGGIVYTDVIPDFTQSGSFGSYFLDVNNDGNTDYSMWLFTVGNPGATVLSIDSNKVLVTATTNPQLLNLNDPIDNVQTIWTDNFNGHMWFNNAVDQYVGLKFQIAGQWHFGWVRVTISNPLLTFTVKDYAYNDIPNQGIAAGDKGSAGANAPVAFTDFQVLNEDDPTATIDVASNDQDADGNLDISSVTVAGNSSNAGASAVPNANGEIAYTPIPDYFGADFVLYRICDSTQPSPLCDMDTLFITVTGVDDAPVANADAVSIDEDDPPILINVVANDVDVDGNLDTSSVNVIANLSTQGANAVPNALGEIEYSTIPNYNGLDFVIYSICDLTSPTPLCDSDTLRINVNSIPDPPVAFADTATVNQDDQGTLVNVTLNDLDVDGDLDISSVTVTGNVSDQNGSAIPNTNGEIEYIPPPGFSGSDFIVYRICDLPSPLPLCDTDTLFITVKSSAPVGLSTVDEIMAISIYPNPVKDHLTVYFATPGADYNIELVNVLGQEIMESSAHLSSTKPVQIALPDLKPGIYYIRFQNHQDRYRSIIRKIVKR